MLLCNLTKNTNVKLNIFIDMLFNNNADITDTRYLKWGTNSNYVYLNVSGNTRHLTEDQQ